MQEAEHYATFVLTQHWASSTGLTALGKFKPRLPCVPTQTQPQFWHRPQKRSSKQKPGNLIFPMHSTQSISCNKYINCKIDKTHLPFLCCATGSWPHSDNYLFSLNTRACVGFARYLELISKLVIFIWKSLNQFWMINIYRYYKIVKLRYVNTRIEGWSNISL